MFFSSFKPLLPCDCLDEYACLWKGCEFLSMGSPAELEVHAYFHNYHGKLKFIGSQLLTSHPDLPCCNQGLHSNNLVPEGSERFACLWEHCDVRLHYLIWFFCVIMCVQAASFWTSHVSSFIQSSFNNPEWFYRHVDNHVESAEQQSLAQQQQALFCQWSGATKQTHFKQVLSCFRHVCSVVMCVLQAVMLSSRSGIVWENTCVATLRRGL